MKTKELTIEEKAKAYDRAIANAKEKAIDGYLDAVAVNDIFPELQSKDEQMRKKCIELIKELKTFCMRDGQEECIAWLEKQGEQKPAEWSEEDERNFDIIYGIIYNSCNAEDASRLISWLKAIKDRVQPQPKQEWSKEDEKIYQSIMDDTVQENQLDSKQIVWLKSLKDRYAFKPSEEQMKALNTCIMQGEISYVGQGTELQSLYNDLKKLTE